MQVCANFFYIQTAVPKKENVWQFAKHQQNGLESLAYWRVGAKIDKDAQLCQMRMS